MNNIHINMNFNQKGKKKLEKKFKKKKFLKLFFLVSHSGYRYRMFGIQKNILVSAGYRDTANLEPWVADPGFQTGVGEDID